MKQFSGINGLFLMMRIAVVSSTCAGSKFQVKDLVCEYHTNPIGIDVSKPRLSWKIVSSEENVLQTAYEIRCFRGFHLLKRWNPSEPLLWKVKSSEKVIYKILE